MQSCFLPSDSWPILRDVTSEKIAELQNKIHWFDPHTDIHGHKVIILLKITVEWAAFGTPSPLAKQIDSFEKRKVYTDWKATNQSKILDSRCQIGSQTSVNILKRRPKHLINGSLMHSTASSTSNDVTEL